MGQPEFDMRGEPTEYGKSGAAAGPEAGWVPRVQRNRGRRTILRRTRMKKRRSRRFLDGRQRRPLVGMRLMLA